ncbi:hypothetical protein ACQP1W_50105 [Spirillospora sp. CA-255316]
MTTRAQPGVLAVAVAALLVAGCGSDAPKSAADGTNLDACKDGTCEVKVTGPAKLPVDPATFKIDTLDVKPEKGDSVSFTLRSSGAVPSASVRVCGPDDDGCLNLGGGGYSSGGGDASVKSSTSWKAVEGSRITANGLSITIVSAADGSAILRMKPA